jgi:hypothetical protein
MREDCLVMVGVAAPLHRPSISNMAQSCQNFDGNKEGKRGNWVIDFRISDEFKLNSCIYISSGFPYRVS